MDQQAFAIRRQFFTQRRIFRQPFVVKLANEVWNDLDLVEIKCLDRRRLKKLRNGRDSVRLLQAISRDRQIRTIGTDQRYVRSMQRRNDWNVADVLDGFAGEDRRDRMGNGVVNVEQIEFFGTCDSGHLCRKGKIIRLMLEQRIRSEERRV